jgi:hypothetical protein
MVVGAPNQGLKKHFALERLKIIVLGFEAFKKFKCSLTNLSCSGCK